VVIVKTDFIKEFFIGGGTLISKCGKVRRAVTDAATKKTFDSLSASRFGESTPGTGCIEQLGDCDLPEDGPQSLQAHAVDSQGLFINVSYARNLSYDFRKPYERDRSLRYSRKCSHVRIA